MANDVRARPSFPHISTVFVGWDNSPRRGRKGNIVANSSPQKFVHAFRQVLATARQRTADERIVFVNAWNEWAEGAYLEPDMKEGRAYLEALQTVLREFSSDPAAPCALPS